MKIEIKHMWNDSVLFAHECEENSLKITIEMALNANTNLSGANLRSANLSGANLSGADLTPIRDDLWAVLSAAPLEVAGLISAIKDGRIDGSTYQGDCACLVGTISNLRGTNYESLELITPNSSRPIERFFMSIATGDTPETSQFSKLALEWSAEWLTRMESAFSKINHKNNEE